MRDRSLALIVIIGFVMWGFILLHLNLSYYGIDSRDYADAALRVAAGQSPYLDWGVVAHTLTAPGAYRYPPTFAILISPLVVGFGRDGFVNIWEIGSLVALVASLALAWRAGGGRLGRNAALTFAALMLFSLPLADELNDGNMSTFLALAVGLLLFWGPGKRSGALGVLASVIKVSPITTLPAILVSGGRRAALGALVAAILLIGLPLALWPSWWAQSLQVLLATNAGDVSAATNLAPAAAVAMLIPNQPFAAELARVGSFALALILVGLSVWRARLPEAWPAAIGLAVVASLLVSPQIWPHYPVILLPLCAFALARPNGRSLSLAWGSFFCIDFGILLAGVSPFLKLLIALALMMVIALMWDASTEDYEIAPTTK